MTVPLANFSKQHSWLVAVDSDGCVFDTMELKHKECFIPTFIRVLGLQAVSKYARETCEFTNLYSKTRGVNRFPAYLLALELLQQRPEVLARGANIPTWSGVQEWIKRETKLSGRTVKAEAERTGNADLQQAAVWSAAVDASIQEMVQHVPPFPHVRETLDRAKKQADVIVCSATPAAALQAEWQEHQLVPFVSEICGQEAGSKKEILQAAKRRGYAPEKMLMVGDAPGDMQAAQAVGACFFPINPGHEAESWSNLLQEGIERFFQGRFAGDYQNLLLAEFDRCLPTTPPWVLTAD